MLRLANRCQSSEIIKRVIRNFKCSVCEELKVPTVRRKATMPHTDKPNQVVGIDYVQVELTKDDGEGNEIEHKFNVLTCVCLATDFAQQIIVPPGPNALSKAFHQAWTRAYGAPEIVYMDPTYTYHCQRTSRDILATMISSCCTALQSHTGSVADWKSPTGS